MSDEKYNVLLSPTVKTLKDEKYAKTYKFVENVAAAGTDFDFDLIVNRVVDTLPSPNVDVKTINADVPPRWQYHIPVFKQTYHRLQTGDFDLYHHVHLAPPWFNPLLLRETETPSVIGPIQAPHSIPVESMEMVLKRASGITFPPAVSDRLHKLLPAVRSAVDHIREPAFRRNLSSSTKIVVVNSGVADYCSQYVSEDKIEVIPYGVDLDIFEFTERDPESMDIVAIGLLKQRKGFDDLLDAFAPVSEQFPEAQLHIFGKGDQREQLEQQTTALGIEEAVMFHGYVSHETIQEYLSTARFFVHPSHSEGFSHVRLEALASGCPVVGTDILGAQDMILDGTTGISVPSESVPSLTDAMTELLSDDDLLVEMSHEARNHIEREFDWELVGERWADLYRQLVE